MFGEAQNQLVPTSAALIRALRKTNHWNIGPPRQTMSPSVPMKAEESQVFFGLSCLRNPLRVHVSAVEGEEDRNEIQNTALQ
jgi:hypothetical protein